MDDMNASKSVMERKLADPSVVTDGRHSLKPLRKECKLELSALDGLAIGRVSYLKIVARVADQRGFDRIVSLAEFC